MSATEQPRLTRASSRGATPAASPRKQSATPRKVGPLLAEIRSRLQALNIQPELRRSRLPPPAAGCPKLPTVPGDQDRLSCYKTGLDTQHPTSMPLPSLQAARQLSATPGPSGGTPGARGTPFGSAIRRHAAAVLRACITAFL